MDGSQKWTDGSICCRRHEVYKTQNFLHVFVLPNTSLRVAAITAFLDARISIGNTKL